MSALLIGLVCIFSLIRLNHGSIWKDTLINYDFAKGYFPVYGNDEESKAINRVLVADVKKAHV